MKTEIATPRVPLERRVENQYETICELQDANRKLKGHLFALYVAFIFWCVVLVMGHLCGKVS